MRIGFICSGAGCSYANLELESGQLPVRVLDKQVGATVGKEWHSTLAPWAPPDRRPHLEGAWLGAMRGHRLLWP